MARLPFATKSRWALVLIVVVLAQVANLAQNAKLHPRRIAMFGSSVANGTGDELGREGYTGLLRGLLAQRGWEVLNQSRGGDTTPRLAQRFEPVGAPDPATRYLLPVRPSYVVLGLSIANEGIFEAATTAEKDAVYKQYADGMKGLIDRARANGITPVVTLAYPRDAYTPVEYEYLRRINLLQNTWDVPSVNFLGAIDDGMGHWTKGFGFDDKHPNAAGHREFLYSWVPSLFEALEQGKPTPARPAGAGFARITSGVAPLTFTPGDTMHAFAVSFQVRAQANGTVAAIGGARLAASTELKVVERGQNRSQIESTTLRTDGPFTAAIGIQDGKWTYTSATGVAVGSGVAADASWHHIVLSHYTARGETLLYVDGVLRGHVRERLEPTRFVLGGPGTPDGRPAPAQADYRDFFVFRAALNVDEAAALHRGQVLQSSLEVYAPLADARFAAGESAENRAQSLSALRIGSDSIAHVNEAATVTQP
jgi:lysophospholipase L1-like esterase